MTYDDEAETLVRSKDMADSILRELAIRLPPPGPAPEPACDVVVLPPPPRAPSPALPPWPSTAPKAAPKPPMKTVLSKQKLHEQRVRRRANGTKLHWAVFAMTAAIAVGLWLDPVARVRVFTQARATTAHVLAKIPLR